MSITEREGKLLIRCFKGCRAQAVVDALGLRMADLFTMPRESNSQPPARIERRIVSAYDYRAPDGTLLYQNVRYEPKTFRIRRPGPSGRGDDWIWSLGEVRRVLYRLPELAEQPVVYLVEGEKDVDRLWSLGLPATTGAAGAESWRDEYADQLLAAGVDLIVCAWGGEAPARDRAGDVLALLADHRAKLRALRLGKSGPWHPLYVPSRTMLVELPLSFFPDDRSKLQDPHESLAPNGQCPPATEPA